MGVIYVAALIVGLGIIAVQLLLSGDSEADGHLDADGGQPDGAPQADVSDSDAGADDSAGSDQVDAQLRGPDALGIGAAAIFLSLRFWTFGLMGFGLLGCILHYLGLTSALVTALSALSVGSVSGWLASYTFLALMRSSPNSGATSAELVGQVGRVLLAPNSEGRAKIRLRVRGQITDYLATTDGPLVQGASVLVEEVRGEQIHVSAAPSGLRYEE